MTYYRLAEQDRQRARWAWKTTPVTSLQAVFQLLRIYGVRPQGGTRVFIASSKEDLNELLRSQNTNLPSSSVTATQFLHERNMSVPERMQNAPEQPASTQTDQPGAGVATWAKDLWEQHIAMRTGQPATSPLHEYITTTGVPSSLAMSLPEQKRLEIELGPGSDHDTPYLFTLPISLQERLAWLRLQMRVQAGELPS